MPAVPWLRPLRPINPSRLAEQRHRHRTLSTVSTAPLPTRSRDKILITGKDSDGTAVNTSLSVDDTSKISDLLGALTTAFPKSTASLDGKGNIVLQAKTAGPSSLTLTLADASTNNGSLGFSGHNSILSVAGKAGDTVGTAIQVFDAQGTAHNVSFTFQKQGNNLWDMTASMDAKDGTIINGKVTGIQFNDDGSFLQVTGSSGTNISMQFAGLSTPQTIGLSFGSANGFNGVTQFGSASSAAATGQDGYTAGFLTGVSVAQDGIMDGIFTNGRTLPIAQLAVARFYQPRRVDSGRKQLFQSEP